MKVCANCSVDFEPATKRQIYCSVECREEATQKKIKLRQKHKRREKNRKNPRVCAGGCGTVLSIYNNSGLCESCTKTKKIGQAFKELKGIIEYEESEK